MEHSIPLRRCYRCEQEFPATFEFFYKHKKGEGGFLPSCKACSNPDKSKRPLLPGHDKIKVCSTCEQRLPATKEFFEFRGSGSKDGFRKQCKICSANPGQQKYLPNYPGDIEIPEGTPTRRCTRCDKVFPANNSYFHKSSGDKASSTGLNPQCKWCKQEDGGKRPPAVEKDRSKKKCPVCKETYPATKEFFPVRKSNGKAGWNKPRLMTKCRICHREARKIYYYTYREVKRDEWNVKQNVWRNSNIDHCRKWYRMWRAANREKAIAAYQRRRAHKMNAGGTFTSNDLKLQYARQKGQCYWCKCKFLKGRRAYHADHYIPLSRGGSNDASNIVLSCAFCNISRKDRLPSEWRRTMRLF